jgi:hypothetical protein
LPHRPAWTHVCKVDPQTGGLLGRYIAEERDSGRRLKAEYEQMSAASPAPSSEFAALKACVEELQREIGELKGVRSAA